MTYTLVGKTILITGAAQRIGRSLALTAARAGADVVVHYGRSQMQAESLQQEITALGRRAHLLQADLADPAAVVRLFQEARALGPVYGLVNNASVYEAFDWQTTRLEDWNRHLMVNLTAPFLLCQAFGRALAPGEMGRIVNLLDWQAFRPGPHYLPYVISKSALAALTQSLAVALAPSVTVNGIALGAILPPSDGSDATNILQGVPAQRWANLDEVDEALLFLLSGPAYITGEVIHLDGGRHLV
jgi:NAD(P)-dependent dehydrogenase (short-subunit alcohol dehydrogenase family)